jgi:transposase
MPWKECHVVDERLRFVARLLDGEKMAALCKEFGISRKTGYKIFDRYEDCGVQGLTDRSRRPYRHANQLPIQIETWIVRLKKDYPGWGAPKIRERLRRHHRAAVPGDQHGPRGARPAGPGDAPEATTVPGRRHALSRPTAERPLVCGLQERIHAGQPPAAIR